MTTVDNVFVRYIESEMYNIDPLIRDDLRFTAFSHVAHRTKESFERGITDRRMFYDDEWRLYYAKLHRDILADGDREMRKISSAERVPDFLKNAADNLKLYADWLSTTAYAVFEMHYRFELRPSTFDLRDGNFEDIIDYMATVRRMAESEVSLMTQRLREEVRTVCTDYLPAIIAYI